MKDLKSSSTSNPSRGGWRVWVAWFILVLFAGEILAALLVPPKDKSFAVSQFAKLPLLYDGRLQPMDSLARNSLIQIRETMAVPLEGNGADGAWGTWENLRDKGGDLSERRWYQFSKHPQKLKPADWLLEVFCNPRQADDRYIFAINHPDLRSLLKLDAGLERSALHYYRFNDVKDRLDAVRGEFERANKLEGSQRSAYDRALLKFNNAFGLYFRLKNTLQPEDSADFAKEIDDYLAAVTQVRAVAAQRRANGEQLDDKEDAELIAPVEKLARRYDAMARLEMPLVVPPEAHNGPAHEWRRMGRMMMDSHTDGVPESARLLAGLTSAYRAGDVGKFNGILGSYRALLEKQGLTAELSKGRQESFFNQLLAFKRSMYVYIMAFLLVLLYWTNLNNVWRVTAARLVGLGFLVHTAGLLFRMWLEGRPPVTNLYSSAIFIGWGAVVLGMVLERFYKDGIGLVVASVVGFLTLIVAHNLSGGGDTMIMMQAVLDTNYWLATHVVIVTLGYASTFVAGFLALVYVLRGLFTKTLAEKTAKGLTRMAYAIVCFATLFSFVGTVLGGIWADQSWGRFWGWDPKENGALIIVLWNALILHLRWGGIIRERGLMNCVIVGNIVTSWSWFGVNLLGIGLHSYGFMDQAFTALLLFISSQLILIGAGLTPARFWPSAPAAYAKTGFRPRAVAVGVPLLMIVLWLTAGIWWKFELAGASRLVTLCLGLSGLYLVAMLCVAFVDQLANRYKAVPAGPPTLPPTPPNTTPGGSAKP
ncbi:MAG TPA: cytochrome c biogenesis protein CcsA [Verrucomicrobiae bacterium]|nr:cytochrome c biogenesis protein CcsA [Verrucomicrobiae bacterium]